MLAPEEAAAEKEEPVAPETASEVAWADKTREQKFEVMKKVVTPKMNALFSEFDSKKYPSIGCPSCHGTNPQESNFAMPSSSLPPLGTDGFKQEMKNHAKATKFMMEKVVPEMAQALGVAPYNPETKQGFGCFNCHTKKK